MTFYILLTVFHIYGGNVVHTQEFNSYQSCEEARKFVAKTFSFNDTVICLVK